MSLDTLLADIEASETGPHVAALFDFDGTIIAGYSATVFLQDALASGELSAEELVQLTRAMTSFGLGNLGFSALMAVHAQYLAGRSEAEYRANSEQLFRKKIARLIYPETRRLIDAHRAKGHTIAIISSATPYQVEPAARDLDIEHVYCTGLEVEDGQFTGAVVKPTIFGEGKVDAANQVARKVGADLDNSFFYSDSTDDIQLLERVGHPVTLNPRRRLKSISRDRNWPSATFDSRGKISVNRFLRSVAATGSLVSSFAAGLPIYALTRSKRDSLNFSISLFADTCNAIIGMDLDVHGEEHLWSHRPAVFMFNHQSKADVAIMAGLVRRDVVGVGKKEIQKMPVIGQVMGMAGTVFIDRSDRAKAIESMKPLVKAMKEQKKSLLISPEGTRTPTRKLAPFKKGGFHIAMQVGVPIVPVVIHNAGDIAPKGDFLFRPGKVRIDVLPPVDTSTWTTDNMDAQVNEVRNMFLRTLGQPEQSVEQAHSQRVLADKNAAADSEESASSKPAKSSRAKKKPRIVSASSKQAKKAKAGKATKKKASAKAKTAKPTGSTSSRPAGKATRGSKSTGGSKATGGDKAVAKKKAAGGTPKSKAKTAASTKPRPAASAQNAAKTATKKAAKTSLANKASPANKAKPSATAKSAATKAATKTPVKRRTPPKRPAVRPKLAAKD